jgi:hypothetical protein
MWNVKATSLVTRATGAISESFRKYQSNITGKHGIRELQKTAISAHIIPKVGTKHSKWAVTLHVP